MRKIQTAQFNSQATTTKSDIFIIPPFSDFYLPVIPNSQTLIQSRPAKCMGKVDFVPYHFEKVEKEYNNYFYSYSEGVPVKSIHNIHDNTKLRKYNLIMTPLQENQSNMVLSANFSYNCHIQLFVEESEERGSVFTFRSPLVVENLLFDTVDLKIGKLTETSMFQPTIAEIVFYFLKF